MMATDLRTLNVNKDVKKQETARSGRRPSDDGIAKQKIIT